MRRRDLLLAATALLAAPGVRAQAPRRSRPARIGFLVVANYSASMRKHFVTEMAKQGQAEGRDYEIVETVSPADAFDIHRAAARAVAEAPDLFFVQTTARALALHRLNATIPIVMLNSGYPVEAGLANSLGRPGKNATGNSSYAGTGVWGKKVELLHEAKPGARRLGVLWGYSPPGVLREEIDPSQDEIRKAARMLGMDAEIAEFQNPGTILAAAAKVERSRPEALIVIGRAPMGEHRQGVMRMAEERRLPTITDFPWLPTDERRPLLTYAASYDALMRQAVSYVVRILGGAAAGDLPIQQPTKFDLVVNLRTARAIGLKLPQTILLRADEVIE
jgi:putative ABC transport system substrate-binding protein